jgi:membrane protein YqaA with SNARE-associated domain
MKIHKAGLYGGTVCVLLAITLTGNRTWFGALLGYWLGSLNSEFLYRDIGRSVQGNLPEALKRMRLSFLVRLSLLSLIVVGIALFQRAWLPSLVVGIAVGIPVSLIFIMRRHSLNRKG